MTGERCEHTPPLWYKSMAFGSSTFFENRRRELDRIRSFRILESKKIIPTSELRENGIRNVVGRIWWRRKARHPLCRERPRNTHRGRSRGRVSRSRGLRLASIPAITSADAKYLGSGRVPLSKWFGVASRSWRSWWLLKESRTRRLIAFAASELHLHLICWKWLSLPSRTHDLGMSKAIITDLEL